MRFLFIVSIAFQGLGVFADICEKNGFGMKCQNDLQTFAMSLGATEDIANAFRCATIDAEIGCAADDKCNWCSTVKRCVAKNIENQCDLTETLNTMVKAADSESSFETVMKCMSKDEASCARDCTTCDKVLPDRYNWLPKGSRSHMCLPTVLSNTESPKNFCYMLTPPDVCRLNGWTTNCDNPIQALAMTLGADVAAAAGGKPYDIATVFQCTKNLTTEKCGEAKGCKWCDDKCLPDHVKCENVPLIETIITSEGSTFTDLMQCLPNRDSKSCGSDSKCKYCTASTEAYMWMPTSAGFCLPENIQKDNSATNWCTALNKNVATTTTTTQKTSSAQVVGSLLAVLASGSIFCR